ncbi:MAG: hypothetical protein ACI4KM_10245 [Oscillospiraceae bacterium]
MTKQIKEYLDYLEGFFGAEHTREEYIRERGFLLQRIAFYSHERLVHLLVTLAFAIMFLLTLFMYLVVDGIGLLILCALFLILLIPYIQHYYFLENSVQRLYTYYYRIEHLE